MVSNKGIRLLDAMEQQGFLPVDGQGVVVLVDYDRGILELHEGRGRSGRSRSGGHGGRTDLQRAQWSIYGAWGQQAGLYRKASTSRGSVLEVKKDLRRRVEGAGGPPSLRACYCAPRGSHGVTVPMGLLLACAGSRVSSFAIGVSPSFLASSFFASRPVALLCMPS